METVGRKDRMVQWKIGTAAVDELGILVIFVKIVEEKETKIKPVRE